MNIDKKQSVALFVGAGAVKNAWRPIIKAVQPLYFKETLSADGANYGLARLVYNLRWFSNNPGSGLDKCKQILESAKSRICEEIKIAQQNKDLMPLLVFPGLLLKISIKESREHQQMKAINLYNVSEIPNCQSRFHKTLQRSNFGMLVLPCNLTTDHV
jgi:hypothetical protein